MSFPWRCSALGRRAEPVGKLYPVQCYFLPLGRETRVWGDQAYRGQKAIIRQNAPRARDFINRRYRHRGVVDETERAKNRTKSKVRARVEHPIGVIKRVFGFVKVRYRGLAKNTHRLVVTCALANLFMARRHLLRYQQV